MHIINRKCRRCSSQELLFASPVMVAGVTYRVWYCDSCGLGKTAPVPDDTVLNDLHSTKSYRNSDGKRFVGPIELLVEGMRRWRIYRLSGLVQKGLALDIGCGSGSFLRSLRDAGWEVAGLELNDDTATSARSVHGLGVETSLSAFSEKTFDLITITHVLEHVRDPRQMLADCAGLLNPGGVIAVAVPNVGSWQARLTGGSWFHLDLPRHLWHFSEKYLSKILCELGYEPIVIRRFDLAQNVFGWLQSLLNFFGLRHNRLYTFLSCDDLKTDSNTHYFSLFISLSLVPLLLPISTVLAVAEAVFNAGGTVEIIARIKK